MKHIVKWGDTLGSIARKYNTTVEALVASNGIKNKNIIIAGQVLNIPEPKPEKNYEAIGKQVDIVLGDVEKLPSFQALVEML